MKREFRSLKLNRAYEYVLHCFICLNEENLSESSQNTEKYPNIYSISNILKASKQTKVAGVMNEFIVSMHLCQFVCFQRATGSILG